MSADLLAAFGSPEPTQSPNNDQPAKQSSSKYAYDHHVEESPWILQSYTEPELSNKNKNGPLWKTDSKGTNVLFDASDAEDEDDFGDFEAAPTGAGKQVITESQQTHDGSIDLLGLEDFSDMRITQPNGIPQLTFGEDSAVRKPTTTQRSGYDTGSNLVTSDIWGETVLPSQSQNQRQIERSQVPSIDEDWGDFEDVGIKPQEKPPSMINTKSIASPPPTSSPSMDDDDWEAFEDGPPDSFTSNPPITPPVQSQTISASSSKPTSQPPLSQPRPTNIPPPSTLLQLLPQIYHNLSSQSRGPNAPPNLAAITLQIYITTAHLVAGRTPRWKRDTILSQSTRISQAGVKNTGMKLTALDKSESVKEDQEAQEAISAWQRHAAALNAVMLKAKLQKPPMSLSANMTARAANGPGVLTAKECCAVCGLNRNERVMGIDVKVEDTFGEFWVEHWGHRNCWEFWYMYEGLLSKR